MDQDGRDRFEIPKEVRSMAEASFDQARKAFDTFLSTAQKTATTIEGKGETVRTGAKDISAKAITFAEKNVAASLDYAEKLLHAKDLSEVMRLHSEYVQAQMRALAEQASEVQTELLMVTPYFIPSPEELRLLKEERDRKARVRILTNSLAAAPSVEAYSGYIHYRVGLLQQGVELYEVRALLGNTRGSGQTKAISRHGNYGLHAKLFVFDRKVAFVGSMNFDQRSKHLNTEIGVLISSPELSREIAARFDALTQLDNAYTVTLDDGAAGKPRLVWKTQEDGKVIEYRKEPARDEWQRLKVKFLSAIPLDKEL